MVKRVRWGIAGSGKIADDFVIALDYASLDDQHTAEIVVTAVGARSIDSAKAFAKRHNIPSAYGSYEELAKDPNVDIVYVSTIHPTHYQCAMLALQNGKGVLCEKPLAMNEKEAAKLVEYARKHNLFFMEAMWTRYFPLVNFIRDSIDQGKIGQPRLFNATFGFNDNTGISRLHEKALGGGCILDIGVYPITYSQMIFKAYPSKIIASGHLGEDGVDEHLNIILEYGKFQSTSISLSFRADCDNTATIYGSEGKFNLDAPFWCPTKATLHLTGKNASHAPEVKEYPLPVAKEGHSFHFRNGMGMVYEARYVTKLLSEGKLESDKETLEESLMIMRIMDEVRRQVGVVYPAHDN